MGPLFVLLRLQAKAVFRRLTRGMFGVKGAVFFLIGLMVVGLWIGPSIMIAMKQPRTDPAPVRDAAPVFLLASCFLTLLTSGGDRAITFTPAEVEFLFPGPFTRRQLLAYKLFRTFAGTLLSTLILSAVLLRHASGWPQAFGALFLAMLFLQLFGVAVTLLAQSAGERAYTLTRKLLLAGIVLAVAVPLAPAFVRGNRPGFYEVARTIHQSRVGSIMMAPLDVYGQLFAATSLSAGLKYAGLAALIDLGMLLLVFYFDADYLEAAAARSQAIYEKAQRVRKGGVLAIGKKTTKWRIPPLPYLGGAGPIVWRQATGAVRNARGLLMMLLILAVAVGPLLFSAGGSENVGGALAGAMAWLTLILANWMRFDFRGDLDQIDHLKALPVSSVALAAGQITTPTMLMTMCHLLVVAGVCLATRRVGFEMVLVACLALPFNALLFGIENWIFLIFPSRAATNPGDVQGYGRQVLILLAKGAIVLLAGGIAGGLAAAVQALTDSKVASGAAAVIALSVLALAVVPLVAYAFRRFDVAADVPA
jgi:hypothetical protein